MSRAGSDHVPPKPRPALRLSLAEREEISRGLAKRMTLTAIAVQIGRSPSTVSREVKRNSALTGYRAGEGRSVGPGEDGQTPAPQARPPARAAGGGGEATGGTMVPPAISRRLAIDFPDIR